MLLAKVIQNRSQTAELINREVFQAKLLVAFSNLTAVNHEFVSSTEHNLKIICPILKILSPIPMKKSLVPYTCIYFFILGLWAL